MRIPFPVHIPLSRITAFAVVLFLVEIYQGTSVVFALYALLFIVIAGAAFNLAGGLSRPSGSYIFFYAVLAVILGLVWKAVLGEPADSNLALPELTMQIYAATAIGLLIAVLVSRKLTLRKPVLTGLITDANMEEAVYGCTAAGLGVAVLLQVVEVGTGGVLSALAQVNRFLPMALILGVIYEMRRTGGRRTVNVPVLVSGIAIFGQGLLGFSKEGLFTPFACWAIAAASQGYRISRFQILSFVAAIYFIVHFLVPYSQYGRSLAAPTTSERIEVVTTLLSDLEGTRAKYEETSQDYYAQQVQGYYNETQGFLDRLQMISPDDALHSLTDRVGPTGPMPIVINLQNLVPHFLWPDKPVVRLGNLYARQMGAISPDDTTTGISFSPAGEAYHIDQWFGVFFWAPFLWILLFVLFDSLCGDTRTSPWGLLICASFAHLAPEGGISGVIYIMGYVGFGLVFVAYTTAYVMPIFGTLVKGPTRREFQSMVRPIRPRVRSLPQSGLGQ